MSRISTLFAKKNKNILNVYCTAGYPRLESTREVMRALQASGADIIEIGMPYSDPLADGPVIQQSSSLALRNGMTISTLFQQLAGFRKDISMPVVLMGYMNPVLQYGFEKFCADAASAGIDGMILPDLPQYEFENEYGEIIRKYNLDFIFLVTPETSDKRIRKLDELSSGFLYAVSSSSTTGSDQDPERVRFFLERLQALKLVNPVLVGFGIKDNKSFETVCAYARGAVVGSAYIKALGKTGNITEQTREFLDGIKNP